MGVFDISLGNVAVDHDIYYYFFLCLGLGVSLSCYLAIGCFITKP